MPVGAADDVESWAELKQRLFEILGGDEEGAKQSRRPICFRGQCYDTLRSSFERWLVASGGHANTRPDQARGLEAGMIRDFIRKAHLVFDRTPAEPKANAEWLALMQHYGAPTRLLDWTYSPYIAIFFAIEGVLSSPPTPSGDRYPEVWYVNTQWCEDVARKTPHWPTIQSFHETRGGEDFRALFMAEPPADPPFVYPINPFSLNERLAIQQGLFLCPSDVGRSFHENLDAMPGVEQNVNHLRLKFDDRERLWQILDELGRMNISRASLYPGIEGFASSYKLHRFFPTDSLS